MQDQGIRTLTTSIEFLTTALRAIADGHAPGHVRTVDPVRWAQSKLDEFLETATSTTEG